MDILKDESLPNSLVEASIALSDQNANSDDPFLISDDQVTSLQTIIDEFSSFQSPHITSPQEAVNEVETFLSENEPRLVDLAADADSGFNEPGTLLEVMSSRTVESPKTTRTGELPEVAFTVPSLKTEENHFATGAFDQKTYRPVLAIISDDSSSESEPEFMPECPAIKTASVPRTLPPPVEIEASYSPRLPSSPPLSKEMKVLGKVSSILSGCVIIEALPNLQALNEGSALYLSDRRPLGEIYETFGPVKSPFYVVVLENVQQETDSSKPSKSKNRSRLRSKQPSLSQESDIQPVGRAVKSATENPDTTVSAGPDPARAEPPQNQPHPQPAPVVRKIDVDVKVGEAVYYVADDPELTIPILCSQLAKLRGSDASGLNDKELSPEHQEFSDDEEERMHRRKQKSKRPASAMNSAKNFQSSSQTKPDNFHSVFPEQARYKGHHLSGLWQSQTTYTGPSTQNPEYTVPFRGSSFSTAGHGYHSQERSSFAGWHPTNTGYSPAFFAPHIRPTYEGGRGLMTQYGPAAENAGYRAVSPTGFGSSQDGSPSWAPRFAAHNPMPWQASSHHASADQRRWEERGCDRPSPATQTSSQSWHSASSSSIDNVGQRTAMPPFYTTGGPHNPPTGFGVVNLPGHHYEAQSRPPPLDVGTFDANRPPPLNFYTPQCPPSGSRNSWGKDDDRSRPDSIQQRF
uniref:H/ACA ribonucleoprotein complex non-core subunit NAF1 n=2 Tax=Schistocephalus solidus TaxID=70667 RepID=A0A0V0J2L9_SCHSO